MLRQRLGAVQKVLSRLVNLRTSRPTVPFTSRRNSPAVCSQRKDFAGAIRPLTATSRIYSNALATDTDVHSARDSNGASGSAIVGAHKLTFQEAITALEQYWAKQSGADCAILLPHNTEVHRLACCGHSPFPSQHLYLFCLVKWAKTMLVVSVPSMLHR